MSLPVRLQLVAQREYDEAADWYEARQTGLGLSFVRAVDATLADVSAAPDRWPEEALGLRAARVAHWPYRVYYQIRDDHIRVIAVFHTSRDPVVVQWRL